MPGNEPKLKQGPHPRPVTKLRDALASLTAANDRLHAHKLLFDAAINNMSQGLCFFDGEQRLIVCNSLPTSGPLCLEAPHATGHRRVRIPACL